MVKTAFMYVYIDRELTIRLSMHLTTAITRCCVERFVVRVKTVDRVLLVF